MSYGIVICSNCNRELHQDGDLNISNGWRHCEDGSRVCFDGSAIYPESENDIKGRWCGRDRGPGKTTLEDLDQHFQDDPLKEVELVIRAAAASWSAISREPSIKKHRGNKYAMCECGSREPRANCCGKTNNPSAP